MTTLILATLALAPLAAWLGGRSAKVATLLALWPLGLTVWFASALRILLQGGVVTDHVAWIPSLGLNLSFRLDGLSAVFALMITGIGTLIVVYGAHYLDGHPERGRFQASLFAFMAAMLGVVLTDNLFTLFVFWELTGFTSFLLIGFDHEKESSRRAATQALIVTGAGGLALLAAAVLISQVTGTLTIPELLSDRGLLTNHASYLPIVVLVLLAAFTKSAQFPFHFWLPGAMAAPTPVSAYLHSATMVKAGVYLVARLTPVLGGTLLWELPLVIIGGLTMLGGAYRAVQETDLKRVLAYSTVSALGTLFLLLGLGSEAAFTAAIVYLVAHACYKGALFQVAGVVDHATGTRDIRRLAGLRALLPQTSLAGLLAAASMVGLPLTIGFVAKELVYEAGLKYALSPFALVPAVVVGSALLGVCGLLAGFGPFFTPGAPPEGSHRASAGLWFGPLTLAVLGLLFGSAPGLTSGVFSLAASAVAGRSVEAHLALWHGLGLPLGLSALTLLLVALLYRARKLVRARAWPRSLGFERGFTGFLRIMDFISGRIGPPLQESSLASYALTFVLSAGTLVGVGYYLTAERVSLDGLLDVRAYELAISGLIILGAIGAVRARTTMTAVLCLGTSGYGVALTFLLFGAPDLAMTQFAAETLTAVIFVFVFWQFPRVDQASARLVKLRDAIIACGCGVLVTLLALDSATLPTTRRLSDFYAEAAPSLAHGRNIVNVILVDFRAFDTLGEITVLVTAAVGVVALLRIAAAERQGG
ncbi:MAG: DUF4040 domain-containing protein [Polyangiaceae bacterium]|nr:DUF4040 domain-containing protein [Polyangiaceae bacterium]MCW5792505.1 DUF4040 domain-containing protein [Polyangiaceae bacterium]